MFKNFVARFIAVSLVATGFCAAVPVRAQNGAPGAPSAGAAARPNPLLKGITLSPTQKTQYKAIEDRFKVEAQQVQQKMRAKYGPQMQALQQGPGTPQEKQAKQKPLMKQILADTSTTTKTMLGRMFGEVDAIMTPAQKPTFNKNKAALLAQINAGMKAAAAQMQ